MFLANKILGQFKVLHIDQSQTHSINTLTSFTSLHVTITLILQGMLYFS